MVLAAQGGVKVVCPKCGQKILVPQDNKTLLGAPAPPGAVPWYVQAAPAPPAPPPWYAQQVTAPPPPVAPAAPPAYSPAAPPPPPALRAGVRPHRGVTVMVLGIVGVSLAGLGLFSFLTCLAWPFAIAGFVLGLLAWVMGSADLGMMRKGAMDPGGEGQTKTGHVCGVVGTILSAATFAIIVLLVLFVASLWTFGAVR
jgi:hypothetical protein